MSEPSPVQVTRALLANARTATLATLDRTTGHPYASLVTVATEPDGTPLLLLSSLALHTRNAVVDPCASLLVHAAATTSDPLAEARVTLLGALAPTLSPTARSRFLERHPDAALYIDFADFSLFALTTERANFIGGFGRIVELAGSDLIG